jgi:hypothetical protein
MRKASRKRGGLAFSAGLAFFLVVMAAGPAFADQVIPDDLIVSGGGSSSDCIGFDCVDGEAFGSDTLRLKENNLRIHFDDTSASGFPANDWRLTANDSASLASGGLNKFSINDVTGARTPFTIEAGAPTNSLYVDSSHRVGFGTDNPILDLHTVNGNTPGLRLEQNDTLGFAPQTWDVAGNEANFFIRDVTGGSRLPFRIRPGAPTSSIDVAASGNVGIDTPSPAATLHVKRTDGTAKLQVEETNATADIRTLLELRNDGNPRSRYVNTAGANQTWDTGIFGTDWGINNGSGTTDFRMDPSGNVTIGGTLTQLSDRNRKENVDRANSNAVLRKLARLPVSTWSYKHDGPGVTHIGPMAQDFFAAYGFGADRRYIAPGDLAGVALAGVKGVDRRVEALRKRNRDLEARVVALEKAVGTH